MICNNSKAMKILLGTHYLKKTGGTENYTYALAMELKRLGHDVEHFYEGHYDEVPMMMRSTTKMCMMM